MKENLSFLEKIQKENKKHNDFLKSLDEEFEKLSRKTHNIPLRVKRIHYLIKAELMKK